jgi:TIR domain
MNALEPLDSLRRQDENLSLPESGTGTGPLDMGEPFDATNRGLGPDVMVSYSSHDRAQVMQFVQRLRAAGVAAWIDQGGIDGAQKWGEEIVNAIDACKTVILMISATSMQSENINKEVMLDWENGKHFLPLCLEDAKIPKSMQYQLAGIQQIKLYEGDPEAKFVSVLPQSLA